MIVVDLREKTVTLADLLSQAQQDMVRILSADGQEFMLINSNESLEEEAKRLGNSARFMRFLAERAQQPAAMSLAEARQRIGRGVESVPVP